MDYSSPGSSVHGILQARILGWVAIPFSRGSSRPRDGNQISCTAGRFFTIWAIRETHVRKCWLMRSRPSWIQFKDLGLRHQTSYHQPLPTHPTAPLPVLHPLQTRQTPKVSRLITPYYFFQIHFLIHLGNLSRSMCIGLYSFLSLCLSILTHTYTQIICIG